MHFNQPCKVLILNSHNYKLYKEHITFSYYGGIFEKSPYEFEAAKDGLWHIAIERGGYFNPKNIMASFTQSFD